MLRRAIAKRSGHTAAPTDSPSKHVGAALNELSCNSPSGPMRLSRSKRGLLRGSPYKGSRRSSRLLGGSLLSESYGRTDDARPLLTPGRLKSNFYIADKHVLIPKPEDGSDVGVTFCVAGGSKAAGGGGKGGAPVAQGFHGLLVASIAAGSRAAASDLLVGDQLFSVDGKDVSTVEEAMSAISEAEAGAMIFLGVAGGTREVVLDKRCGDCGMTCARATHATRGVLLKRIAKGSLADAAKLYPGDTILSINGKLINHHQVAVDEIDACEDVVRLVLLGESTELHLPASLPSDPSAPLGITLANHEDVSDGAGVRVALGMLETQMSGPDPTNPFLPIKAQPKASVVVVQSKYSARR